MTIQRRLTALEERSAVAAPTCSLSRLATSELHERRTLYDRGGATTIGRPDLSL